MAPDHDSLSPCRACHGRGAGRGLKTSPADIEGNRALNRNPAAPLDPALMPALVAFIRSVAH